MARPVTRFTDDELRGILAAAADADAAAQGHNDDFLDRFINGVALSTGRLYGQPVYERLLGAAGIVRRPSAQTWVKAIDRARARGLPPRPANLPGTSTGPMSALASGVAAAPVTEAVASGVSTDELVAWKARVQVAEATARDAYARIAVLDAERAGLIARTAAAEGAAQLLTGQLEQAQRDHKDETAALLARIDTLAGALDRLSGMERHLRLQTDQLRQEMSQQAQFYKGRADAAEKALAVERSQTDAMRKVLGNRATGAA
ncbi:MAG: hypothetical protein AB1704_19990 [Pseudomonadota bacterium]